jgi:hypothetical protein
VRERDIKRARQHRAALGHNDEDDDDDDDDDDDVVEPCPTTAAVLKLAANLSPSARAELLQVLADWDANFRPPPPAAEPAAKATAEPAEEPSPRPSPTSPVPSTCSEDEAMVPASPAASVQAPAKAPPSSVPPPVQAPAKAPPSSVPPPVQAPAKAPPSIVPPPASPAAPVQAPFKSPPSSVPLPASQAAPVPVPFKAPPYAWTVSAPKPPPANFVGRGEWRDNVWVAMPVPAAMPSPYVHHDVHGRPREPGCDYFGRPLPTTPTPSVPPLPPLRPLLTTLVLPTAPSATDFTTDTHLDQDVPDDNAVCTWCGKVRTEMHVHSVLHKRRREEIRGLNWLLGPRHGRVLVGTTGRPCYAGKSRPLCKALLREHWGPDLESFPRRAVEVFRRCGVKISKKTVAWDDSFSAQLAVVPYSGSGGYGSAVGIPYDVLPEFPHGPHNLAPMDLEWLEQPEGWWPVVAILPSDGPWTTLLVIHGTTVQVVCVWQTMWRPPAAWPIRMALPRARM